MSARARTTTPPRLATSLLVLLGACVPETFPCDSDDQCGPTGRCVEPGYCAFQDESCESSLRYGKHSPPALAEACVDPGQAMPPSSPHDGSDNTSSPSTETTAEGSGSTGGGTEAWETSGALETGESSGGTEDAAETEFCGNGVLDDGESCDDGNTTSGDGCSEECSYSGEQLMFRVLDEDVFDDCAAVRPTDDGGAVLGGYTRTAGGTAAALIVRVDAHGNELWRHRDHANLPSYARDMVVGPNTGALYVVGSRASEIGDRVQSRRFSADGELAWSDISFAATGRAYAASLNDDETSLYVVGSLGAASSPTPFAFRKAVDSGHTDIHYPAGALGELTALSLGRDGELAGAGHALVSGHRRPYTLRFSMTSQWSEDTVYPIDGEFHGIARVTGTAELLVGGHSFGADDDRVLGIIAGKTMEMTSIAALTEVGHSRVLAVASSGHDQRFVAGVQPLEGGQRAFVERRGESLGDRRWIWTPPADQASAAGAISEAGDSVWACGSVRDTDGSDVWIARLGG